jgi:hypothetical protein
MAQAGDLVPVRATGRQGQRPPRRDADEASARVEHIEEVEEIVLVGPTPMEQDERALGIRCRRPHSIHDLHEQIPSSSRATVPRDHSLRAGWTKATVVLPRVSTVSV